MFFISLKIFILFCNIDDLIISTDCLWGNVLGNTFVIMS